jgi:hypothetical protein
LRRAAKKDAERTSDDPIWDPTTFTMNRERLQNGEVFAKFMTKLLNHPQVKPLLTDEHFRWTER